MRGSRRHGAGQRHALLFAARQHVGRLVGVALEVHPREQGVHPIGDLRPAAGDAEGHVLPDRQMRKQREILEDQADATPFGRQMHACRPTGPPHRRGRARPSDARSPRWCAGPWTCHSPMAREGTGCRRHRPKTTRRARPRGHRTGSGSRSTSRRGAEGMGANDRSFQSGIAAIRPHRPGNKSRCHVAGRSPSPPDAPVDLQRHAMRSGHEAVGRGVGLEAVGFSSAGSRRPGPSPVFSLWTLAFSRPPGGGTR
jgi:hypothetical protein